MTHLEKLHEFIKVAPAWQGIEVLTLLLTRGENEAIRCLRGFWSPGGYERPLKRVPRIRSKSWPTARDIRITTAYLRRRKLKNNGLNN
jgi:hypothetical protein